MMSSKMKDADNAEDLVQAFRLFDKDGTGMVPAQELRAALQSVGEKMSKEDIDMVFQDVKIDPEGFINYDSLATLLMN
jgi:calmodulin